MNASVVKRPPATHLSATELRRRWRQMLEDPLVSAIPFKVELNEKGAIEVTPANTRHGMLQAFGTIEMYDERGRIEASSLGIALTLPR